MTLHKANELIDFYHSVFSTRCGKNAKYNQVVYDNSYVNCEECLYATEKLTHCVIHDVYATDGIYIVEERTAHNIPCTIIFTGTEEECQKWMNS